jgi:hypothetical protein
MRRMEASYHYTINLYFSRSCLMTHGTPPATMTNTKAWLFVQILSRHAAGILRICRLCSSFAAHVLVPPKYCANGVRMLFNIPSVDMIHGCQCQRAHPAQSSPIFRLRISKYTFDGLWNLPHKTLTLSERPKQAVEICASTRFNSITHL